MKAIAQRSLRLHASWLARAVLPNQHPGAPLTLRRAAALALGVPPYLLLQTSHWLGFALDEVLYPGDCNTPIEKPVFILGLPRSGTTFLHRSLAQDEQHWSTFKLWQAVFAPSITQRRACQALIALDQRAGHPARALLQRLTQTLAGALDDIHPVSLEAAEEDYLTLLPAAACFVAVLAFPYSPALWQLCDPATMPTAQRDQLITFYRRMLQKHMRDDGRTLLSKNAAFGGWAGLLAEAFPDARFIVCIRDPDRGLSSQLSSIRDGQIGLGSEPDDPRIQQHFADMFRSQYLALQQQVQMHAARMSVVDMDDLRANPAAEIERLSNALDLDISAQLIEQLGRDSRNPHNSTSAHQHHASHRADAATHRAYAALKATTRSMHQKAS